MKHLTISLRNTGGRNSTGRITTFHRGGANKARYRLIDFDRVMYNIPAIVRTIENDPSRSAYISLVCYKSGILSYILAADLVRIGDLVVTTNRLLMLGNALPLNVIPSGSFIYNVQFGNICKLSRAAGTWIQLLKRNSKQALLKLPSGKRIVLPSSNMATLGKVSNPLHRYKIIYKAGRNRWAGIRPTVRGVAMNPVDHPMGGKTHGKLHRTPWGKLTKGIKTRKKL